MYRNVYIGVPKDRCRQADFDSALPMAFQSAPMSITIRIWQPAFSAERTKVMVSI